MTEKYILDGHKLVPCEDLIKWATWFETANRTIARKDIGIPVWKYYLGKWFRLKRFEPITISTVFLGLDHSFGKGPPLLFETMIFGGKFDSYQERYSTWEQAEAGHLRAIMAVESGSMKK